MSVHSGPHKAPNSLKLHFPARLLPFHLDENAADDLLVTRTPHVKRLFFSKTACMVLLHPLGLTGVKGLNVIYVAVDTLLASGG